MVGLAPEAAKTIGVAGADGPQRPLPEWLVVRGAREHNLADLTVALPHRSLVVFTGLSGSGKSTLAFDTIYAECQRRQVQSMSAFARQFIDELDKPAADAIGGLCPAVALDQRTASRNPRSTVGTVTDIYDLLRVLYSRLGWPHCTVCGAPLRFNVGWLCPDGHPELGPSMTVRGFSFNLPDGACSTCQGIGAEQWVDPDLVVPEPQRSLAGGALAPWRGPATEAELTVALAVAGRLGIDVDAPWAELPAEARDTMLDGTGVPVTADGSGPAGRRQRKELFQGIVPWLHRQYRDSLHGGARDRFAAFMRPVPCPDCGGERLNARQRSVRIAGLGIGELCARTVVGCLEFFRALELDGNRRKAADQAIQEIAGAMQLFLSSDTIYAARVYPLIENTLRDADVGAQQLQESQFIPGRQWLDPAVVADALGQQLSSGGGGTDGREPAPGLHGTGIDSVQVGEQTLEPDAANRIAYGADTEFTVNFTNQGEHDEVDVVVVLRIEGGPEPLRVQKSVASVPAGTAAAATLGLDREPPLDTPVTITVQVKPVPGEEKKDNNTSEYDAAFFRE